MPLWPSSSSQSKYWVLHSGELAVPIPCNVEAGCRGQASGQCFLAIPEESAPVSGRPLNFSPLIVHVSVGQFSKLETQKVPDSLFPHSCFRNGLVERNIGKSIN